jgi:branched-chain amino acid transport system ATP-binding protein
MSGGKQQMLPSAALMAKPRLLMLDEPSMGLAPLVVAEIHGERTPASSRPPAP